MQRRTWTVLALTTVLALAAAPTAASKVVVEESTDESYPKHPHLDVKDAAIAQMNVTEDDERVVGGFYVEMGLDAAPGNRSMYAFEFRHDATRYRLQANYTSEPIPEKDLYASGWYASLEKSQGTSWIGVAEAGGGSGLTFDGPGSEATLTWVVHDPALIDGLAAGSTFDHTKAFSFVNDAESGDAEEDLEGTLSDTLEQTDEGSTLGGWIVVDIEPGGDGADYQVNAQQGTVVYGAAFTFQDPPEDADGDGVYDPYDNCPDDYNPGQADADGDGAGDACDVDPDVGDDTDDDTGDDTTNDDTTGDDTDDTTGGDGPAGTDGNRSQNTTGEQGTEVLGGVTVQELILPLGLVAAALGGVAAFLVARGGKEEPDESDRRPPRR